MTDGERTMLQVGVIFGFALCFLLVSAFVSKRAKPIADEERLQAMRKEGW